MNKIEFKNRVEDLVSQIEDIINKMPYKGDSETESQKIYLMNKLNQFSYAVNGVEDEDFILGDED
jgi:frataxin-like iron-binding protein CyaY